ncbi:MAG: hypothetical protein JXB10_04720 [Pirellulales bacterium]|nr:hypothetical protein [Pirellulales bacterium]
MLIFWRHRLTVPCLFGVLMLMGIVFATASLQINGQEQPGAVNPPMPKAPAVSTFAPADDLVAQAEWYLKDLKKCLTEAADYEVYQEKIVKEANTLAVVALALGLHDKANPYKPRAGGIIKASQELAAAKKYPAAKSALAKLQSAAAGKGDPSSALKWEQVASLPELMKQVPTIHTKFKRNLKPSKFKKKAKLSAGYTAVLAAIAQGSMADLKEAKNPQQVRQWYALTEEMRDVSAQLNRAIRRGDQVAATAKQKILQKNCEACHAVFKPDVVIED